MLFNSWQYAVFLPLVVALYFLLPRRARWMLLLAASYYFYMSWNPELVVLIVFVTLVTWLAALGVQGAKTPGVRRAVFLGGMGASLACLFFFKYFNFFSAGVRAVLGAFSLPVGVFEVKVLLPVGISFYTFQALGYLIDVYRGTIPAERHLGIFALFVSFFPQLVAGPIERAANLLPQFYEEHTFSTARCSEGLRLILLGLFKKVLVADVVSPYVEAAYAAPEQVGGLTLVAATVLFAVQIYCDFSAYSDIAVGSARILGFRLMENFKSPYLALSIQGFWRRWHISLSTWFTDYVYIPLGGNRVSRGRHLANLFLTFLLSGLWHGAALTFVCWGAFHGLCLCLETFTRPALERFAQGRKTALGRSLVQGGRWAATMAAVLAGWVLFRADTLADALTVFRRLPLGLNLLHIFAYLEPLGITPVVALCLLGLLAVLALWDVVNREGKGMAKFCALPPAARYGVYVLTASLLLLRLFTMPENAAAAFIYFQF